MIKDNQKYFNRLQVLLDAVIVVVSYILAWFIKFRILPYGNSFLRVVRQQSKRAHPCNSTSEKCGEITQANSRNKHQGYANQPKDYNTGQMFLKHYKKNYHTYDDKREYCAIKKYILFLSG